MSSLFSKPKSVKIPPNAPSPLVEPGLDELDRIGYMRRARKGRRQTLLTGDTSPMATAQRTLLG